MKTNNKELRDFGLIWAIIFLIIALFPLKNEDDIRSWSLIISSVFFIISITYPQLYKITYFYQSWIKFGNFIGKINSKIIMLVLFYFIFFPIGIFIKIFRKDLLNTKIDKSLNSYFIDRKDQPVNMENQF